MSTDWSVVQRGALLRNKKGTLLFYEKVQYQYPILVKAYDPTQDACVWYPTYHVKLAPVEAVYQLSAKARKVHWERYPEIYGQEVNSTAPTPSAFSQQVDGKHYSEMPDGYQPFQISHALGLNPVEHTILKYLLRHRRKNGKVDLEKIKHCVDILIEQEYNDVE